MDRWSEAYVGTYNYSNKNEMQELTTLRTLLKLSTDGHANKPPRQVKKLLSSMLNVKVALRLVK
jgi:hypothetical protein